MRKFASLLAILFIVLLAVLSGCQQKPVQSPQSQPSAPSSVVEPQKVVPEQPKPPPEVQIPSHYATYKDESQLFSISYPPEWEPALSVMKNVEQQSKDWIDKLNKGIPVEQVTIIFMAGLPTKTGYLPNVNIAIEPVPTGVSTLDQMSEAEVRGIKQAINNYREISRVKTTVDGREAVILHWQGTVPNIDIADITQLFVIVNKVCWVVSCGTSQEEYAKWEKDFNIIGRSFRILK